MVSHRVAVEQLNVAFVRAGDRDRRFERMIQACFKILAFADKKVAEIVKPRHAGEVGGHARSECSRHFLLGVGARGRDLQQMDKPNAGDAAESESREPDGRVKAERKRIIWRQEKVPKRDAGQEGGEQSRPEAGAECDEKDRGQKQDHAAVGRQP